MGRNRKVDANDQGNFGKYLEIGIGGMWCRTCKKWHPVEDMVRSKTSKYGLNNLCRKCKGKSNNKYFKNNHEKMLEHRRRWAKENPEKIKEINKRYKEKNPGKQLEAVKRWAKNNPDKVRESNKKYYNKNKDKVKKSQKIWRENNPDKVKEHAKKHYNNNSESIKDKQNKRRAKNREIKELEKEKDVDDFFNKLGWSE